jgi:excisionase family DNA binding protein
MQDEYMTITETAKYLKISKMQLYRLLYQDKNPIPFISLGEKSKRISLNSLKSWLDYRCPNCNSEMNSVVDNVGGNESDSHYILSNNLKCPECGGTKTL